MIKSNPSLAHLTTLDQVCAVYCLEEGKYQYYAVQWAQE